MMPPLGFVSSLSLILLAVPAFSQEYKYEPIPDAPAGVPSAYPAVLATPGARVSGPAGVWCEIWPVKTLAAGKSSDASIAFGLQQGVLMGVLRFPGKGSDRRGQVIPAGLYTMRYSLFPVDGAHSGVAPQRDFVLLTPIGADANPAATPSFEQLVQMSEKASGTPHPAVLSIETPGSGMTAPGVAKEGEKDWVLTLKAGEVTFSVIVVGKAEG
jgi:hypothetical protein